MRDIITKTIEALRDDFFHISQFIGNNPELGNEEFKAAQILTDELIKHEFDITMNVVNQPTAFIAVYDSGLPGPHIGFMSEYDALPEVGHACGHNLIGTMGVAAGIALSKVIHQTGGKISVFGTPAEETRGAKVTMAEEGIFNDLDVAMMSHPSSSYVKSGTSLAMDAIQFAFHGRAAHAAAAPQEGINALDAVIQTFNGINALRQHVTSDVRIHGIIPEGGKAANVVPDYAVAQFYVRANTRATLNDVAQKVIQCAKGAELATGAKLTVSNYEFSYDDMVTNEALSECFTRNLISLGVGQEEIVTPSGSGSLDMGNVSHCVPSIHPFIKISEAPIIAHTHEFREAALSKSGFEGMLLAAKTMALTGFDVLTDETLLEKIKAEFQTTL
ncbi:M20 family metallopeptidase [Evansella cellulosilytica]|uniref:Peptidase M20 domain-containing protein 2 n=1 Tax=Evansella cellulosilytica (strain ATCC 21833 / DSM 2522 / FERM P-1141 / JCM 9156 / N-4) TaxID=649639 RepID=E6TY78_EVAC2|nr:M20 family metallopeptidase [Evansella cellulosilytica]ADU32397.1 amidohydrolase [Evansella cellulosilytica DSM 2522]